MAGEGPNLRSLNQATFNIRGRKLGGKYEIIREIGSGGMGKVYLSHETPANRYVAVKILHPSYFLDARTVERFLQEAKVCLQLRHPNTTAVFDFGSSGEGLHFMVMELLKGRSLFDILDQYKRIELQWAIKIVTQMCDSLAEAHGLGIVHRDLKPENVFVEPRPGHPAFVKVLDFGIAKEMSEADSSGMTEPGEVFGTPTYMSPEQAGGKPCDARSDIYALGVMLYEMLVGTPPFEGPPLTVLMSHVHSEPPPFPDDVAATIPVEVQTLVLKLLSKEPADRPASTKEVRSLLLVAAGLKRRSQVLSAASMGQERVPGERGRPEEPTMDDPGGPSGMEPAKCSITLKNVASGNICRLVRSGVAGGVLIVPDDLVQHGDRMVLLSEDNGLPSARLIVDVTGYTDADGNSDCPVVQWVRIVCTGRAEDLSTVLTVLGMDPRVQVDGDELAPDEFLVYEPLTQQVRRVALGA